MRSRRARSQFISVCSVISLHSTTTKSGVIKKTEN
jgi:hypothetical protein